jgi:hypothetical protein
VTFVPQWSRVLLWLGIAALGAGCATAPRPDLRAGGRFETLAGDPRVHFEPGAEQQALRVADLMPQAIEQVEAAHYRPFAAPVAVYVCGTERCFSDHVTSSNVSAATVPDNLVFLSPRLFDREAPRLPMILTHELSHLHLGQQIGHYTFTVPVWFHEGLAAWVSNGGGADYASEDEARQALQAGRAFDPATLDTPGTRHRADFWKLSPYLFYREAMMFLDHLKQSGEDRFRDFLLRVQDRQDFAQAFGSTYNMSLEEAGRQFRKAFAPEAAAPASPTQ